MPLSISTKNASARSPTPAAMNARARREVSRVGLNARTGDIGRESRCVVKLVISAASGSSSRSGGLATGVTCRRRADRRRQEASPTILASLSRRERRAVSVWVKPQLPKAVKTAVVARKIQVKPAWPRTTTTLLGSAGSYQQG